MTELPWSVDVRSAFDQGKNLFFIPSGGCDMQRALIEQTNLVHILEIESQD